MGNRTRKRSASIRDPPAKMSGADVREALVGGSNGGRRAAALRVTCEGGAAGPGAAELTLGAAGIGLMPLLVRPALLNALLALPLVRNLLAARPVVVGVGAL